MFSVIFHDFLFYGGILFLAILGFWFIKSSIVYINNESYGIVEKLWSFNGKKRNGFISLNGEPGFQPELIKGGIHWFFPFMYHVHKQPMITVKGIAYLFARDGTALPDGQTLAKLPEGVDITNAREFLEKGGQQGPQRKILRQGFHAVNTALFAVFTEEGIFSLDVGDKSDILARIDSNIKKVNGYNPIVIDQDGVGVVTINDGPSLEHGEIVAPTVGTDKTQPETFHNSFQSIEKFLNAGGRRGRQEQVLVEGTYYINCLFATIEYFKKVVIDVGNVGVVISYSGSAGKDVSGEDFLHGQLVTKNERGIWKDPYTPGKYAINPYAMNVRPVPTTNLVLRWEAGRQEAHGYDQNLQEIKLITGDAFEPIIGLSMVINIKPEDAPYVIQQFSDIQKLVEQTLDTIVASWFKDSIQKLTLIELISQRSELQAQAQVEIGAKFAKYRIQVQNIMLGTPRSEHGDQTIEAIYNQLRDRQMAREEKITYAARQSTVETLKSLNEAQAVADNQTPLTASKIQIEIAENDGMANLARKKKEADALIVLAEANARQTELNGDAEAKKITAIGLAEANASAAQVEAYGGPDAAMKKAIAEIFASAIKNCPQPIVPQVVMGGNGQSTSGLAELFAGMFMANGEVSKLLPNQVSN